MGLRAPAAARRTLRRYLRAPGVSVGARLHVAGRWLSCPFPTLEALVPPEGRVLEIGCGHGLFALYLALASPDREVYGVDIDRGKLADAELASHGIGNVVFGGVPLDWLPAGEWPTVAIVDVLYLLGADAGRRLLAEAAAAIAPGGRLIVKEIDTRPRWKYRLAVGQELAATRVARVTAGATVEFLAPDDMEAVMAGAGLRVTRHRIDRGYPHPHLLLLGERPRSRGGEPAPELRPADDAPAVTPGRGLVPVGAYALASWS